MAIIKITVEPKDSTQRVFNASQLAAAIHSKKVDIEWNDDKEAMVDTLWEAVAEKVVGMVTINEVQTNGMKARLLDAKIKKRAVPKDIVPGRNILQVRVLEKDSAEEDEDGPDQVPIPFEINPPADQAETADFAQLVSDGKITFSSTKVKNAVTNDKANSTKAASLFSLGSGHKGHGPTTAIGGLHTHVTNRTALGFKWNGDKLQILGVGEKNDSAAKGNSGYDWTT